MQHCMADDEIEGVVLVRDALGVGNAAVDLQAQVLPVAGGHLDHAGRQVGHRSAPGDTGLDQVEQEESASAAQLQLSRLVAEQLAEGGVEAAGGGQRLLDGLQVPGILYRPREANIMFEGYW